MKFENVNQELTKWVDRGFFKNIWYYIKDISNYGILFILEDSDYYDSKKWKFNFKITRLFQIYDGHFNACPYLR